MKADSSSEQTTTTNPRPESCSGEFITRSARETFALAKHIGEQLSGGEVFLLKGDLGAGKTVFAKGLASGIGIDSEDVTSPTFTLINAHEGRLRFYHIDLYRLEPGAQHGLGLEEIFDEECAVTVVEWAERLGVVPSRATIVEMSHLSNTERKIVIGHINEVALSDPRGV
ncbi:MAG TPA: tRNA (adenosine(37)-N6)-threonylcarbamoyltransferase complex ATPase subunit type 1 TsaE [Blastocatellia bacterium]|nr:tRNA (adenosine(37)-N6)-threonylcarbamoyltransferase complex ATPase subunit type 1 TsaE [Blastocatellia bacterium]